MNNRVNIGVALGIFSLVALYISSELFFTGNAQLLAGIVVLLASVVFICLFQKRLSIDFKLLVVCIFGYFVAAKGFSYISPAPPLYIGEILLGLMAFSFLRAGAPLRVLNKHILLKFILFVVIIAGVYAAMNFTTYKLLAIRDYAMVYYGLFAILAVYTFSKEKHESAFRKAYPVALLVGLLAQLAKLGGLWGGLYSPHPDIAIPVAAGVMVYAGEKIRIKYKHSWAALFIAGLFVLVTGKASAFLALIVLAIPMIFLLKRYYFIGVGAFGIVAIILFIGIDQVLETNLSAKFLENDFVSTVGNFSEEAATQSGTTGWRLEWWKVVYEQVKDENMLLGLGFGADITGPFLAYFYNIHDPLEIAKYARYPHNIFFTVLGRTGVVGVIFLVIYTIMLLRFLYKFMLSKNPLTKDPVTISIIAFVLAGFANAFVQSTYENPYAGIMHWVCLGYLIHRSKKRVDQEQISESRGQLHS